MEESQNVDFDIFLSHKRQNFLKSILQKIYVLSLLQRNCQFHEVIRDYLLRGDGGPYFETYQEIFEIESQD